MIPITPKQVTIQFLPNRRIPVDAGVTGDDNAVQLVCTLPEGFESVTSGSVDFLIDGRQKERRRFSQRPGGDIRLENGVLYILLSKQYTRGKTLRVQVGGQSSVGGVRQEIWTKMSETLVFSRNIGAAYCGGHAHERCAHRDAVEDSHWHINKAVLDGFDETGDGELLWNGLPVCGGAALPPGPGPDPEPPEGAGLMGYGETMALLGGGETPGQAPAGEFSHTETLALLNGAELPGQGPGDEYSYEETMDILEDLADGDPHELSGAEFLGLTAGNTYSGGLGGWINMDPWADAGSWSLEHLRAGSLKITCGGQEYTATSVTAAAGVDDAVDAVFDFQTPGGSEVTVTLSSIYIQYGSLYGQAEMAVNSLGSDAGQSLYHSNIGFVLDPHTDIRPLGCELALAFARPLNDAEECGVLLSLLYSLYDGYGVVVDESLPGSLRLQAAAGADAVSLQYIRVGEGRFDLMDCAAIVEWEDGELRVIVADNGNLRFDAVHCERLVKTETAGEVA